MEIRIEGEVTSKHKSMIERALCSERLVLRINSYGGDVFAAMDIYNALRQYKPGVTICIEGLCASAATVVACAGHSIIAHNGLYMIHRPSSELSGMYESAELAKTLNALEAIEGSLIAVYAEKTWLSEARLKEMMSAETWLTASEALSDGFVDEIGDFDADVRQSEEAVMINALPVRLGRFKNAGALRGMEAKRMTNVELWKKLQSFFGMKKSAEKTSEMEAVRSEMEALKSEMEALKSENERLKVEADAADRIAKLIGDNLASGASRVTASSAAADAKASAIEGVLKYAGRK